MPIYKPRRPVLKATSLTIGCQVKRFCPGLDFSVQVNDCGQLYHPTLNESITNNRVDSPCIRGQLSIYHCTLVLVLWYAVHDNHLWLDHEENTVQAG